MWTSSGPRPRRWRESSSRGERRWSSPAPGRPTTSSRGRSRPRGDHRLARHRPGGPGGPPARRRRRDPRRHHPGRGRRGPALRGAAGTGGLGGDDGARLRDGAERPGVGPLMLYAYAITGRGAPPDIDGLGGAALRAVGDDPVAIVSEHDELPLRSDAEDLWAHEA